MSAPRFFRTPAAFRDWLAANHDRASELVVGFYKKDSGKPSITWERRDPAKSGIYSFDRREAAVFDVESERRFQRNRAAWTYFQAQPPGYRRLATHYVVSAKQPETREKRLAALIEHSARGERLPQTLSPKGK